MTITWVEFEKLKNIEDRRSGARLPRHSDGTEIVSPIISLCQLFCFTNVFASSIISLHRPLGFG
jgi:hypothetical protein